jgi:YebC/PmpR family DNA-binding regulatory protein
MAGHSKWANIKHRKAGQDAKRGKMFTKLIHELTVAAKEGGGDIDSNPRLRLALDKALSNNMKKDTIDKAIQRGSGQLEGQNFESVRYEGYGPNGIAIMIDCLTDNKQRTVAEVRHILSKNGGNLGTDGSVAYLFEKKGVFRLSNEHDEESILEIGLSNGAEEVETLEDGNIEITCTAEDFPQLNKAFEEQKITPLQNEISHIASLNVDLPLEGTQKTLNLIDALEDLDDVQQVYTNLNISDELMEQL